MTDKPNYNDGNWHGWNGGECPVDVDTIVEGMYLRGDMPAPESPVTDRAGHFDWEYEAANTLIAFRVIKEHREPRAIWVLGQHNFDTEEKATAFRGQLERENPGRGFASWPVTHFREVTK